MRPTAIVKPASATLLALLFFVTASTAYTQQSQNCNTKLNSDYLLSYWHATVYTIKQPARYSTDDWLAAAGLGAIVAITYSQDRLIYNGIHNQQPSNRQTWQKHAMEGFGSGLSAFPLLAGIYAHGLLADNSQSRHAALAGGQAFLLSAGAAYIIKTIAGRERPGNATADPGNWTFFSGSGDFHAFPSGHSMRAFALASVLAGIYDDKPWLGAGFYALASLTAFSRLSEGKHWPSDVLAGAVLGYGIGRAVLHFNRSKRMPCMGMSITENGIGMAIRL